MAIKYTPDQQKVIDLRDCNILVSAAAGSGKTAVLTERIVERVCDAANPIQIDRMLIVTFTNAAAAEMRERIGNALRKRLEREPWNDHLRKQVTLLNNAQITTIDSFCLYLLRNHFHEINLDPAFRIADDGEIKLLEQEMLDEYLEAKYEEADPGFLELVELYAGNGKDKGLKDLLQKLYTFSRSNPFPEDYINECIGRLQAPDCDWNRKWENIIFEYEKGILEECIRLSEEAIELCRQPGGPYTYEEAFLNDIDFYQRLLDTNEYSGRANLYATHRFKTLSSKKADDIDEEIKTEVKKIRDGKTKKNIGELKEKFYYVPFEELQEMNQKAGKSIAELLKCVMEFAALFEQKKREKNVIDFSDMEHLALRILLKKQGDDYVPGDVALEYQKYFDEIMVDEYQDSNQVQECLIESISRRSDTFGNRFMVGDVKQSIYRFRLARPEIFMEKYNTYNPDTGRDRLVNLSMNFRSRKEVLDGVNAVFEEIMVPAVGKVEYDAAARLYLGANYKESTSDYNTEVLLYDKKEFEEEKLTDVEAEAYILASHIKKLRGNLEVTDKNTGELRPAGLKDMVILLRKASGVDDVIKKILEKEGIPTYVNSGKGYFDAEEIREILNFLSVLDNPRQDIPLMGVMHSVFGKFTETEVAQIRIFANKKGRLYDNVAEYATKGADEQLRIKATQFLKEIEEWRDEAVYHSVYELLEAVLDKTGFLHYCMALPGGAQRKANLMVFLQKAKAYESGGHVGLFDFIRYMEMMKEKEVDFGEANILDENAQVVRIMTIHKSKGLEFPICFVAGLGKKFNDKDSSDAVLMDSDLGVWGDYYNLDFRYKQKTLQKNVIAVKKKNDSRGEDLRILYVAMTRAKEKLILLGNGTVSETLRETTTAYDILKAKNFMELILPIAVKNKDMFTVTDYTPQDVQLGQSVGWADAASLREGLKGLPYKAAWKEYRYPHNSLEGLYTKTTVSELKKAAYLEEYEACEELYPDESKAEPYVPGFISGTVEEITGGRRGSAYHRIMELMDFTIAIKEGTMAEDILAVRKKAVEELRISSEDDMLVQNEKVIAFMQTDLAKRMGVAQSMGKLHTEQPFMIGVQASLVNADFPAEEDVLVQGVIDVYFEEEDGLVLMDYKTDRVLSGDELIKRYQTQLVYYAQALERLTHKKVKEKLIYSFALHEVIKVD